MTEKRGLVVGAISSHGHERGHVGVLDQLAEVESIHVCAATDLVSVEEMAAESARVVGRYTDVAALLERPDLDAVIVCARPDHAPAILEQVVSAGLPVLYDKPAAIRASDLRRVAGAGPTEGRYRRRNAPVALSPDDAQSQTGVGGRRARRHNDD